MDSIKNVITNVGEVRGLVTLGLTAAVIAAVFTGQLDAKELLTNFGLVIGFYFGAKTQASQ